MYDKEFLIWLHQRLYHLHGDNPNADFMGKLRSIIKSIPGDQLTPNMAPSVEEIIGGFDK